MRTQKTIKKWRKTLLKRYGKVAWNKGLTKEIDERVKRNIAGTSKTRLRLFNEGKLIPHNKGKTKENYEPLRKLSKKLSGKNNPHWKGGKRRYHQYIARKLLGSLGFEVDGKHIHHINGNWKNNKVKNLLILTPSEHTKLHWKQGDIK